MTWAELTDAAQDFCDNKEWYVMDRFELEVMLPVVKRLLRNLERRQDEVADEVTA